MIEIGFCKDCKFVEKNRVDYPTRCTEIFYCGNEDKLFENGCGDTSENDYLSYSYQEGGGFEVGPQFGCIHWLKNED